MSIIKAGYRITVESWENDADNQRTMVIDGIQNKEYAALIYDVMSLLECRNYREDDTTFGNLYEPDEEEWEKYQNALKSLCEKHNASKFFAGNPEFVQGFEPHEYLSELIFDLHGSSEYYATRVTESITVEYTPVDIVIEDVTKEFV